LRLEGDFLRLLSPSTRLSSLSTSDPLISKAASDARGNSVTMPVGYAGFAGSVGRTVSLPTGTSSGQGGGLYAKPLNRKPPTMSPTQSSAPAILQQQSGPRGVPGDSNSGSGSSSLPAYMTPTPVSSWAAPDISVDPATLFTGVERIEVTADKRKMSRSRGTVAS